MERIILFMIEYFPKCYPEKPGPELDISDFSVSLSALGPDLELGLTMLGLGWVRGRA